MADTKFSAYLKSGALCLAFFALGLVSGVLGPTMLDLQCALGVSYDDIVSVLPVRSAGQALGCLTIGFLYDRVNPLLILTVTLGVMGFCTILIPLATSLMSLSILQFICLLCLGLIDPCGNVLILYIWGKGGQDYLLTIHFTFGLGGLVAPLVTSPFLYTGEGSSLELDGNATSIVADLCVKEALRIHIPYAIMGAFSVLTSCLFLYLFCCHRHTTEHESRLVNVDKDMADGVKQEMIRHKRIVVVVAAIFLLTLMCFSLGMSSFVSSFAVLSDLHLGKQDGAYLLSLFYFTYTFYLLFSIPLVNKIGINRNIIMELGLIVLANIFLVPFGNSVEWCLWVGVALMGLGISTMYASLFVLLEGYFPVTGGIASFLTVVAFLGGWMYPVVMGYAIGNDPQFFLNVILMFTVACILLFAILSYLLWKWFPVKHDVQKQTTIDSCES